MGGGGGGGRLFTATHPQVLYYNIPTSCSLQHTYKLLTTTYPQVIHYNIPTNACGKGKKDQTTNAGSKRKMAALIRQANS